MVKSLVGRLLVVTLPLSECFYQVPMHVTKNFRLGIGSTKPINSTKNTKIVMHPRQRKHRAPHGSPTTLDARGDKKKKDSGQAQNDGIVLLVFPLLLIYTSNQRQHHS